MKGLYLIFLMDVNDVIFKLVDEPTYNWIINGGPIPLNVKKNLQTDGYYGSLTDEELEEEFTDCLDSEQDLRGTAIDGINIDGENMCFSSIKDFLAALKKHNIVVNEVYEGCFY